MSEHHVGQIKGLPENAYQELKAGEEYKPLMPASSTPQEITPYSVIMGLLMAVLFSAAAAYLGLKIGQVFEAAIPIAIIAVGVSTLLKIKSPLGQNVIIQSIGQNSGLIVAGTIFTIPALYILNLDAQFYQIFLASAFGGILGILFLIPFRKYFVSEMHGKFPFPEATATTEILVAGEKGGKQALVLVVSGLIGGAYDFIIATFGWWSEIFTTRVFGFGEMLADKFKLVFRLNVGAAVMGLGYIVGLKYSAIIAAGSCVSWFLLVPVISYIGGGLTETFGTGATKIIISGLVITTILLFLFFNLGVVNNLGWALAGVLIVLVISFLFTTVAANAIAIVGTNPVSGMTLMTLILSSIVLTSIGLRGQSGMIAALIIGGVVCTALSMAGGFITDLKIGYWLGSTPRKQEQWKVLGVIVSALTVGFVMMILNETYGFVGEGALVAPQANAMAAVIQPLMDQQPAPWTLYIVGAILALVLTMIKVPALAFALGMYIPLELNTPLLVGGLIAHFVSTRSKDEKINNARRERGTLIASGFIAGGALMGVISAFLRWKDYNWVNVEWAESHSAEMFAIIMFSVICLYMIWDSLRGKLEE